MIRKVVTETPSYKLERHEIKLVHPGGTTEWVPVETITKDYISIRWGMSGVYDIFLEKNVIVARSLKARRKGKCYWKATDIEEVRKWVVEYLNPVKEDEFKKSVENWERNKPGVKNT